MPWVSIVNSFFTSIRVSTLPGQLHPATGFGTAQPRLDGVQRRGSVYGVKESNLVRIDPSLLTIQWLDEIDTDC